MAMLRRFHNRAGVLLLVGGLTLGCGLLGAQQPAEAPPPLPDLVRALESDNPERQYAAAKLISEMAQKAQKSDVLLQELRDAGRVLPHLLDSPNEDVRAAAIEAIGHTRPRLSFGFDYVNLAGRAFPRPMKSPSTRIRLAAVRAIGFHINRTLEETRAASFPGERLPLMRELVEDATAFAGPIVIGMRDSSPEVRNAALQSAATLLSDVGKLRSQQLGDLGEIPSQFARFRSALAPMAQAFAPIGQSAAETLAAGTPAEQRLAAGILEELAELVRPHPGPEKTEHGLLLNRELAPEGEEAARVVDGVLAKALPALVAALNRPDASLQRTVLDTLEIMGDKAKTALPAVIQATKDDDRFVRWATVRTLGKIDAAGSRDTILALADLLGDVDYDVRLYTLKTLEQMGAKSVPAVSALERSLQRPDVELQIAALDALKAIGAEARAALPTIIDVLKNGDVRVRKLAPDLLANLGPAATPALPALRQALSDPDPDVRQAAGRAILRILAAP
jgi:HEAT repeat protein